MDSLDVDSVFRLDADRSQAGDDLHDQATVDEMKIQTMYKMVDDVDASISSQETRKRVMYLTNKQASLFDSVAMGRCIQALDLGKPKLVIKLMTAMGPRSQAVEAHSENKDTPIGHFEASIGDGFLSSELDFSDERIVESQAVLFLRTCLLPLAIQTRAIIVVSGANDCFIASALANVCMGMQARMGKDCPFTVVCTVSEYEVHYKAVSAQHTNTLAAQIARGSKAWRQRMSHVNKYHEQLYGPSSAAKETYQMCDLSPSASHCIVFEGIDEKTGKISNGPKDNFEAVLLQSLTENVPSIAISTFGFADEESEVKFLVDLASRNIPVLLIDTRERAFSSRLPGRRGPEGTSGAEGAKPRPEGSQTCGATRLALEADQFPMLSSEQAKKMSLLEDGVLPLESRMEMLEVAKTMLDSSGKVFKAEGVVDMLDASLLAFLHSVLIAGAGEDPMSASGSRRSKNDVPLYELIWELERLERTNKDSRKAVIPTELVSAAIAILQMRVPVHRHEAQLAIVDKWLQKHDQDLEQSQGAESTVLADLVSKAQEFRADLQKKSETINEQGGVLVEDFQATKGFLSYYDLLTSANVFSGSMHDIDGLKRVLGHVARIDRLPTTNSLQAMRTLREAWDHVEAYEDVATRYKLEAKATYVLFLLLGIAITALSILDLTDDIPGFNARMYILSVSFVAAALSAYVSYTNPSTKWQQLRVAAQTIQSNIWLFRSRAGVYRAAPTSDGEKQADDALIDALLEIKSSVLEGAGVKDTMFFSRALRKPRHGQRPPNNQRPRKKSRDNRVKNSAGGGSEAGGNAAVNAPIVTHADANSEVQDVLTKGAKKSMRNLHGLDVAGGIRLDKLLMRIRSDDDDDEHGRVIDNHYSPVHPELYVRFRVSRAIAFYKGRIPRCHYVRNIAQTLLVLGSIGSAVLAYLDIAAWAAVVSVVSGAITAYIEFQGTNSKISRYSSTVNALEELVLWWQTLPSIDKSVVANIDRLVITCEELLQREQQAWRSTSQSVKLLQKYSREASSNGGGAQQLE